jgi:hypothetical protein
VCRPPPRCAVQRYHPSTQRVLGASAIWAIFVCPVAISGADESINAVYSRNGVCPSTHPYRIPRINHLVMYTNADGAVPNPLIVSAGVDDWHDYSFMHADYLAANQPVFNDELLDLCLRNAPDSVTFISPRCGEIP